MVKSRLQPPKSQTTKSWKAPWPRSDVKLLESRWFAGESVEDIAATMHRPISAIRRRLEYQGWW